MRTTKNYMEAGGNIWVVGGEISLEAGAKITAAGTQYPAITDHAAPESATAAEIAAKQNQILAALRGVGIIATE